MKPAKTYFSITFSQKVIAVCLLFFMIILGSCEKIIDINLNDSAKKYVIEGFITDNPGDCRVKISQTVNFSDTVYSPGISDAVVTIRDNDNPPVVLTESVAGIYRTDAIQGTPGHTYSLSVSVNGSQFSATSTMPHRVNFDSLYIQDFIGFGDAKKFASVVFNDPPGKGNSYHFTQRKNNLVNNAIFIVNDNFSDGRQNNSLLVYFDSDDENMIKKGDTVSIDMKCIDEAVYKYWFGLQNSSTGSNDNASPGNPVSNIKGGALGYFSAQTFQTKTVITP